MFSKIHKIIMFFLLCFLGLSCDCEIQIPQCIDNYIYSDNYRMFKTTFEQERYLNLLPKNLSIKLIRFRTTNNCLPVNKLRYENIPRNERLCPKCEMEEIGDEFHYVFCCPYFHAKRVSCLPVYFRRRPNAIKFNQLFNSSKKTLLKLVHFMEFINKELKTTHA